VTDRTGAIADARAVTEGEELIIVSQSGIIMRTTVESIARAGRSTQGVHVMNIGPGDRVACIAAIDLSKVPEATASDVDDGTTPDDGSPNGNGSNGNGRRTRRRR
jgi:DNA gyrase subunit A